MQSFSELLEIGTGLLDTEKYLKAIDFFNLALELEPNSSEAHELRGIAWFRVYNIEESIKDTERAIELDSENHQAWFNKGELYSFKKNYAIAEIAYKEAIRLYPESLFYLTGVIKACGSLKKYNEAIKYCNIILKEKSADYIALNYRGIYLAALKNYPEAIRDYLKLLEIGKQTSGIYNNLGFWYSKINEITKAENNLIISLQLNPTHPYALNNLGYVKYLRGEYKEAIDLFNTSLSIDHSNSYAYKNRALTYIAINQTDLALSDLKKAKSLGYEEDYDNEVNTLLSIKFGIKQ